MGIIGRYIRIHDSTGVDPKPAETSMTVPAGCRSACDTAPSPLPAPQQARKSRANRVALSALQAGARWTITRRVGQFGGDAVCSVSKRRLGAISSLEPGAANKNGDPEMRRGLGGALSRGHGKRVEMFGGAALLRVPVQSKYRSRYLGRKKIRQCKTQQMSTHGGKDHRILSSRPVASRRSSRRPDSLSSARARN